MRAVSFLLKYAITIPYYHFNTLILSNLIMINR